jgi:YteA family regulatory protein
MDNNQKKYLKERLTEEAQKTASAIENMKDNGEAEMSTYSTTELSNYDNHPADIGSELYTAEMNLALKVHEQSRLKQVNRALKKFENGTYGTCEKCNKPISYERLQAVPYARLCMECEKKAESAEINTPDMQYDEIFDAPFGRKYLNKQEDDEFEGMDQLNDLMKYGSADSPQDMGGYHDYEEYYTNELDNQGIVEETDKISNKQYKDQLP